MSRFEHYLLRVVCRLIVNRQCDDLASVIFVSASFSRRAAV